MDVLNALVKTPAFWAAIWALLQGLITYFLPTFPPNLMVLIDGLVVVIFGVITGQGLKDRVAAVKSDRLFLAKAKKEV